MSTINVNQMVDSQGGVLAPISSVMRNRIINGAMTIDQRNAGASVTPSATGYYTVDRFWVQMTQASKFSIQQQSTTVPSNFTSSLKVTSLAATTLSAGDYFTLQQSIEGNNIADLGWGTANAKTVTLSFRAYSSLTGTFGGVLCNSAFNRTYPFTYTISAANTWTTVSITIPGDTSGTWLTTNVIGIQLIFGLGVGSTYSGTAGAWAGSGYLSATGATSVVGTNGATFYLTGVQLEKGTQATSFEYRQYGQELALCQRYFQILPAGIGSGFNSTTIARASWSYNTPMRAASTLAVVGSPVFFTGAANVTLSSISTVYNTVNGAQADLGTTSGVGATYCCVQTLSPSVYFTASAEL